MNATKKQDNWYAILDSNGKRTGMYITASNIKEAMTEFKTNKLYSRYRYFGKLVRVYNGGVRG